VLLHDNASPYTAICAQALLEYISLEFFDHPSYSPDIAPSDGRLFSYIKCLLGSQSFKNNEELMESVKTRQNPQTADFSDTGIRAQKHIPRYDKCLNSSSDYVEE
jgi:hypothetical protein